MSLQTLKFDWGAFARYPYRVKKSENLFNKGFKNHLNNKNSRKK